MTTAPTDPVVIVHGYLSTPMTNAPLRGRMAKDGIPAFDVPIPGLNTQDMRHSAEIVHRTVEDVRRRTGAARVRLVGVSMGGVIGLYYVRCAGGHATTDRLITLASPLAGTPHSAIGHMISGFTSTAARQLHPESPFMREIRDAPHPEIEVVSVTAPGDPIVTVRDAVVPGVRHVEAPHGRWPLGHYYVLVHRRNYRLIRDLLQRDLDAVVPAVAVSG